MISTKTPNRTEQLARFLRDHGDFMSAREIQAAGFCVKGEQSTSITAITCLINNIRQSARFKFERQFKSESTGKHNRILVISIDGKKDDTSEPVPQTSVSAMWSALLYGRGSISDLVAQHE